MNNDTNPKTPLVKFEAILEFKQTSRSRVFIHARTLAEAEDTADNLCADDIETEDWNLVHGDVHVLQVRPAEEAEGKGVDNE